MSTKIDYNSLKNKIIFHKYKINKIIGKGSFGCVFQGINIKTKKLVAIKVESKKSDSNLLQIEVSFLSFLKGYGIPKIYGYGKYANFRVMIQEILGFNLMQIKNFINRFTIKDIAMMGIQMMDRIELVHSKYIIHRDIKPENFTTGYEDISTLYLIDYGISRKYRSSRTGKHLKYSLTGRMFGTVRYASYNASRGVEQSRRDDLESIGHMLIYIYTGKLPWKGISLKDKQRRKKYLEMLILKKYTTPEQVCKNMPKEFLDYYKYCKSLNFEQDPDYEYLRNVFRRILLSNMSINDYKFSWISNKNYLKNAKNYNHKMDINNIKQEKYINIFKRTNSPGITLYRKIKNSIQKIELEKYKKSIGNSEHSVPFHNNMNSNLDLDSVKTYNRGNSENVMQINTGNNISETQVNLNNAKTDLTYKSDFTQYNMDVDEFQDEAKIYEQNKTMINMIKNSKDDNLNYTELQSFNISDNKSTNNKSFISKILKNFKWNNNIKYKLNLSLDLGLKYKNNDIINDKNNHYNRRSESEKIKNHCYKRINLTYKETEIKIEQEKLFNHIMNKIYNNINKIVTKKLYKKNGIKLNPNTKIYISKHAIYKTEKNSKNEIISQNFSFKNLNVNKGFGNNSDNKFQYQPINKNILMKNNLIKEEELNKIKINKAINKARINANNNNKIKFLKNNNNIQKKVSDKNILENGRRINIIINTNVNSFAKLSPKNRYNNNISKKPYIPPIKQVIPRFDKTKKMNLITNLDKQKKIINNNNNLYYEEIRNNNFMKNIQNKNNIILIPKQSRPLMNMNNLINFSNNRNSNLYHYKNGKYFTVTNDMNNNLTNSTNISKVNINNNKLASNNIIRTFEYKSILNKNNNSAHKYSNSGKKGLFGNENIQVIRLKNLKQKKMIKNNSYDFIKPKLNLQNKYKHLSLTNLNKSTNKVLYYGLNPKNSIFYKNQNNPLRIRHYSPDNNIPRNNYINLDSNSFNILRNNRSNSDSKNKKVLNYNSININDNEMIRGFNHKPLNINNLNNYYFNQSETKCFNRVKL